MKIFNSKLTRGAMVLILIHAVLVIWIGISLLDISLDYIRHPGTTPLWRVASATAGSVAAVLVGSFLTVLSVMRLRKSFDNSPAGIFGVSIFAPLLVVEALVIFVVAGMILDCGETQSRLLLGAVALNLFLLVLFGGNPTRQSS
jgi:hypothetical protein